MTLSYLHVGSLLAKTAAFTVLNYSDTLNTLTSRITSGRVNQNTLAESVIQQASSLALDIAETNEGVSSVAQTFFGMDIHTFIDHARVTLLSDDEKQFSQSVESLISSALAKPEEEGSIPKEIRESAPNFAADMINNYVGKKAIHQLLGAYVQAHGWETITQTLQAQVSDGTDSYTNRLTLAGVRLGSNLVHSLIKQGIVEQMPAGEEVKAELKLAAGCLHAYLSNESVCEQVINGYVPSKALINDDFLKTVTDLSIAYANHAAGQAITALDNAQSAHQTALKAFSALAIDRQESSLDGATVQAAQEQLLSAQKLVDSTKATAQEALQFAAQIKAIKNILVSDVSIRNDEERLASALGDLVKPVLPNLPSALQFEALNSLKDSATSAIIDVVANELSAGTGLPVQNIVGTFVARYGWDALEAIVIKSLEKNLSDVEDLSSDDCPPTNWMDAAVPKLASKLAIAHLAPYFEDGRFDKRDSPAYVAITTAIHDDEGIKNGDLPTLSAVQDNVFQYLGDRANQLAANNTGYAATALQAGAGVAATLQTWTAQVQEQGIAASLQNNGYILSAAAISTVQALSTQVMEEGLVNALQSNAVSVGTNTFNYVSNATNSFLSTAQSMASQMVPKLTTVPVSLIA